MQSKYFYCYSNLLKNYLVNNELRYISKAVHYKTNNPFWIFEGTEELNNYLKIWRANKN